MIETVFYIFLAFIVVFSVHLEIHKWNANRKMGKISEITDHRFPLICHLYRFMGLNAEEILDELNKLFMSVPDNVRAAKCWAGPLLFIGVVGLDDVKTVLTSEHALNKPYFYEHINSENGMISSTKERWRIDRKNLVSTFNSKMVARFLPMIDAKAKICCDSICSEMGIADIHLTIMKCVLDMNIAASFGIDCQLQSSKGDFLCGSLKTIMKCEMMRIVRPWLKWDTIYRLTKDYLKEAKASLEFKGFLKEVAALKSIEFNQKQATNNESENHSSNLNFLEKLFVMLRQGLLTDSILDDHIYIINAAGVDTATSAIYNVLLLLAIHQEYQVI